MDPGDDPYAVFEEFDGIELETMFEDDVKCESCMHCIAFVSRVYIVNILLQCKIRERKSQF